MGPAIFGFGFGEFASRARFAKSCTPHPPVSPNPASDEVRALLTCSRQMGSFLLPKRVTVACAQVNRS